MTTNAAQPLAFSAAQPIAKRFVDARRTAAALPDYPGPLPTSLPEAYAIQDAAIGLWGDRIAGWKVGRINPPLDTQFGEIRLIGPIFARSVWQAREAATDFPVFAGGFAAVEAEFVFEIAADAPAQKTQWTHAEAEALAGRMFTGIETAGSPLATINALGPTVVISDFGNNAGLILGRDVEGWRGRDVPSLACETFVNGRSVGSGHAGLLPGGPVEALRFTAALCATRGRPLKKGMLVSTGAATGIHELTAGDTAHVAFESAGTIRCRAVPAKAESGGSE